MSASSRKKKFLITNDDGIDAPGIAVLERIASEFGETVVAAPTQVMSGCGHQVTVYEPIQVFQQAANRFAVAGTPADCARLGLAHFCPDADWVLSGVNAGGNLGVDVFMSGTAAAAREAAYWQKPAVAFSQYRDRHADFDWEMTAAMTKQVLQRLLAQPLPEGDFWNVNLPDSQEYLKRQPDALQTNQLPEMRYTSLDPHRLAVRYQQQDNQDSITYYYDGVYQERERKPGSDVDQCFAGYIAVTRVS